MSTTPITQGSSADAAWEAFYAESATHGVRARGRGDSIHGCVYRKSLYDLAAYCDSRGYDVLDYVSTVMSMCVISTRVLTPRALLDAGVMARYAAIREHRHGRTKCQTEWDTYMAELLEAVRYTNGQLDPDVLLLDATREYPAWFRVFGAMSPCAEILRAYGPAAMVSLRRNKQLAELVARLRPSAVRVLEHALGPIFVAPEEERRVELTVTRVRPTVNR